MPSSAISFDHIHLISSHSRAAADWYVSHLGGEIVKSYTVGGAPQIHVSLNGATVVVRGQRDGEQAGDKPRVNWGIDHFGFTVQEDFDGYCAGLKAQGVRFSLPPTDFNPTTRIAYVEAPDGVTIELVHRRA